MTAGDWVSLILPAVVLVVLLHCPIFKPWFGFRKPPGHRGHWFE